MGESQNRSVQRLASELGRNVAKLGVADRLPVQWIAENRVPILGEMHSNLMCSPCFETTTNQSASVQKLDGF
jgi:hypothetical protein